MSTSEDGVTRRQLLVGGGAAAVLLAAAGVAGGRSWTVRDYWYRLTGAYGEPGAYPPRSDVLYQYGAMPSSHVSGGVDYGVATPGELARMRHPAGWKAPVCFCLPGWGRAPRGVLQGDLRLGDFAAQAVAERGAAPFVLVAVRGGDTYWHPRASGEDAMAMLLDEFIPYCRRELGLGGAAGETIMGWSMGGYGALLAAESWPRGFAGVCAVSAALWRSYDDGVGHAFDSAADYAAHDVYAGAGRLDGLPVRLDCGRQDPFYEADKAFAEALPQKPQGGFGPGGHNDAYWRRVAPPEIDFIAAALSRASAGSKAPVLQGGTLSRRAERSGPAPSPPPRAG
jgi:enterochelin esterase-like enzyme